ncbi:class I SAM-dependent methyltransferase [Rhodanobacter sp. C05]|uniref:class I SAM-dependent methyltransferase n=1 Tax=Rhodanobacter sp. C05 TaxID=1945855 RepID=UPI0009852770|nr:class I SAM-dependent methyltransferase [Rhodanobacter sp. C05]OOG40719.1 SAM-dependent methyltransferase [Rhodanobacter sp. C05]
MDRNTRARITSLYDTRLQRGYVKGKLASDPVYAATAALLAGTQLPLLDIGCGLGLLGHFLHAQGHRQPYVGLDHDVRKINAAQRAVHRAGLDAVMSLRHGDATAFPTLHGHVTLLDVLHYLPREQQQALLLMATRQLAPQGILIIRNVLREPNWRFQATRLEEFFLRTSGWIRGGVQHYPSADELRGTLESAGLDVHIESLRGRTPFNSYLIVAQPHR